MTETTATAAAPQGPDAAVTAPASSSFKKYAAITLGVVVGLGLVVGGALLLGKAGVEPTDVPPVA